MTGESKLDALENLLGETGSTKKKKQSRLSESSEAFDSKQIKKATGAKASEGTVVISFRVPEHIERMAMDAAAQQRVPYAEFKKAAFYRGVVAFATEGEEVPMDYGRTASAAVPDVR